jgi:hypothetical protein
VERVGSLSGVVAAQHLFFDDLRKAEAWKICPC